MKEYTEIVIDPKYMNQKASIFALIIATLALIIYFLIWGFKMDIELKDLWKFYLGIFIGIILHEGIHAFGFIMFGKAKLSEIKFGIIWKHITPYAHCKIPMTVNSYRISLMLPVIITGILPMILALAIGNGLLMSVSIFLIAGGIGDLIIFYKINTFSGNALLKDLPDAIGCIIYK